MLIPRDNLINTDGLSRLSLSLFAARCLGILFSHFNVNESALDSIMFNSMVVFDSDILK